MSAAAASTMLLIAFTTPVATTGVETVWLAPSLCSVPGGGGDATRFVSYVAPDAYMDGDGVGAALGAACPADVKPAAQEFVLPATLTWAPLGGNESLVVFHGDHDTVTLSYTLKDASGRELLRERGITLVPPPPPPDPAASAVIAADGGVEADGQQPAAAAAATPTGRRLLKGGGRGYHSGGYRAHSYGSYSHSSVHYSPGVAVRTRYGYSSGAVIRAGVFVSLMHHPSGYGRYYDTPGCDDPSRGCDLRIEESLSRDVFAETFTLSASLVFPLTLTIEQCDVTRTMPGEPSVFFTFYSPTGGVAANSTRERMINYLWLPLLLFIYCGCVACAGEENMDEARERRGRTGGTGRTRRTHDSNGLRA